MSRPPSDAGLPGPGGTRTARSKFLEAVKAAAEANHLEFVEEWDGPNSGCGRIQKHDGFINYYSFHFEFGTGSAVFYLGTDSVDTATPEQQRKVDYRDGKAMEQVLDEIRNKIGESAGQAFPHLQALSNPKDEVQLTPVAQPKPTSLAASGAPVWGQDEGTLARERYRYKGPPRSGHAGAIAGIFVLLLVVLTLAPVSQANGQIVECRASSCQTFTSSYQSVSFREFGVGAVYVPQGKGWGFFGTGTLQVVNGSLEHGMGLRQYYIVG